jgi:hypothetical protein
MPKISKTLLAAVAAVGLVATATPADAATGYVPSGKLVQQFAPTYIAGEVDPSASDAVALAKKFDVILAHRDSFTGNVAAMQSANPRLRILDYLNAAFAQAGQGPPFYPESWYARDANNNLIKSKNFGNYLMDISKPEWANDVATRCHDFVASDPGFKGCFLDVLGTAPIHGGYVTSLPVNPATGHNWTDSEWINATTALAKAVKNANPTLIVSGNGLANGKAYFDSSAPTARLWPGIDGGEAETFVRIASDSVTKYRPVADWKKDVDMLVDAAKRGESVFALTKLWVTATAVQKKAWHKYALATFLLGTNGKSYFRFTTADTYEGLVTDTAYDHVDVGGISGAYALAPGTGVYRRNFTKGIALVNPTTSTYTVSLGGSYKDLDGVRRTSITMAPHTGEVLVRVS